LQVDLQTIRGQLDAIRQTAGEVVHEDPRGNAIARADDPTGDQLCIRIDCRPSPYVASTRMLRGDLRGYVLGLGVAERPALIDLDALAVQIAHNAVLILGTRRTSINGEFYDRVDSNARHAAGGTEGVSLDQGRDDLSAAGGIQSVHTDYYT
jgi:hypothetical protein